MIRMDVSAAVLGPQENLRQLCVYRLANESGKPWVWWDYITRFGAECSMHDRTYNQDCAEKVSSGMNYKLLTSASFLRF